MILLGILIIGLILAFVLNRRFKQTNGYKNQFSDIDKIKRSLKDEKQIQIVALGSNHPKFAFDFSETKTLKGANWCVGPETFEYDFAILKQNRRYLADNALVIMSICVKNFFLFRQINRRTHTKYYAMLPPSDVVGYTLWDKWRYFDYPLLFRPLNLRFLLKDVPQNHSLDISEQPLNKSQLKQDADKWIACWDKEFNTDSNHFQPSKKNLEDVEKNIAVLRNTIDYCLKEHLRPILVLLPLTEELGSRFSDEYVQDYVVSYIDRANPHHVPFLNYLRDKRFTNPELYINSFFFNTKGRSLFTEQFLKDISEYRL